MTADKKTIIRRIVDYLHKYGTDEQVLFMAQYLNISVAEKQRDK